jgi:hypothetical protein
MSICFSGDAQEKYEHERRIKADQVPISAVQFVKSVSEGKKVKWFEETSQAGTSIEAKFKIEGYRYSIEFSTAGEIQDLEIEVSKDDVSQIIFEKIEYGLDSLFTKFKIQKIQIHYNGSEEKLLKVKQGESVPSELNTGFELVIRGKSKEGVEMYEVFFDAEGSLIRKSIIILNPTDNLVY